MDVTIFVGSVLLYSNSILNTYFVNVMTSFGDSFLSPSKTITKASGNFERMDARIFSILVYSFSAPKVYFFNPFSVEILRKVLAGIYESYYEKPREILLMFYYPSEEYLGCLMTEEQLMFYDEINTEDLFEGKNDREKILIFSVD